MLIVFFLLILSFILGMIFNASFVFPNLFSSSTFWQAVNAVATMVIGGVGVYLGWLKYKEEKRKAEEKKAEKIIKTIINPLREDLKKIIAGIQDRCSIGDWRWGKIEEGESRLVDEKSFESTEEGIEKFHKLLSNGQSLLNQCYNDLENLIKEEIRKREEIKIRLDLQPKERQEPGSLGGLGVDYSNQEIDLISTKYNIQVRGIAKNFPFFRLIFEGQNLDNCIKTEEAKERRRGRHGKTNNEEFILNGFPLRMGPKKDERKIFNEIFLSIFNKLEEKPKIKEYIDECRRISKEAYDLSRKLNEFSTQV